MKKLLFVLSLLITSLVSAQTVQTWPEHDSSTKVANTLYVDRAVSHATPLITDATLTFSDILTNNSSTSKHGFLPKLPGDAAMFINGLGTWSVPGGSSVLTRQFVSSGSIATFTGANYVMWFNFSSTAASFVVTMPPSPANGDKVAIRAGGILITGAMISSLTVLANSGQTIIGLPPNNLTVGDEDVWEFDTTLNAWYRIK